MADRQQQPQPQPQHQIQQQHPRAYQIVKAATAVTAGGSFMILSGLTLAGTVIALAIATPVLVLFSPVLVPAVITVCLLIGGLVTSGGFGVAALWVVSWMYRYVTGKHPPGADQLDQARRTLASKARDMKEFGQQQLAGGGGAETQPRMLL